MAVGTALATLLAIAGPSGCGRGVPAGAPTTDVAPVLPVDPDVEAARAALAAGRPWQATERLAPLVRDSGRRTPAVTLLAAQAAAAWEGWDEVARLLDDAPWLDGVARGEGRALLARAALARGAPADAHVWRLVYPIGAEDLLRREAAAHGLDPTLVAALIRQESSFAPRAVSPVGARGLMQLMPEVGERLAARRGFPVWDRALLFQPDVNVRLGTAHLRDLLRGYREEAHALAAYNAGAGRVARWRAKPGTDDVEVFVERIPYVETRDYVRIVQRNRALYAALYPAAAGVAARVAAD